MLKFTLTINSLILYKPITVHIALPYTLHSAYSNFKSIWALHCAGESGDLFFSKLPLSSYVDKRNIALIAPDLGNGYFINTPFEKQYDFLSKELMPILQNTLPLSSKQEDTSLLGISMGAFGASRWALSDSNTFSKVALISGTYDFTLPRDPRINTSKPQKMLAKIFGETIMPTLMLDTKGEILHDANISPLYAKVKKSDAEKIKFNLYCGDEDYISLNQSQEFIRNCVANHINAKLHTSSGEHNEEFWHRAICTSMEWILNLGEVNNV